jgi:4-alpha-glucanotransferase
MSPAMQDDVTLFAAAHPDVGAYARFRAGRDAGGDLVVEQSHLLAQFLADQQLAAIHSDPHAAALALDLPIGSHPEGYEVWADPPMFAPLMSVGAPPDAFFADGQNWGFPPPLPAAMHASGHRLWRQLIERVGRHADILRIDHAMAVHRLWWVPDGCSAAQGAYVTYPREEILAVIAASAAAAGVTIVGEDLGTVPPEVSDAFERWDVLGMYEEQFHLDDDPLPHIPARTVAGIRTHDMEPLAELVTTTDTSDYRRRLGDAHGCGIADTWDAVVDQMLERLSWSDAYLAIADLDDLVGERRPHNLPGRVGPELWSRRLDRPTSETLGDPSVRERLGRLSRRHHTSDGHR